MTTVIRGTDNSVSAPAVSGSDGDTGLYFPAANQVALATNGTQAVFVDSSQNVGIGTSSPDTKLNLESGTLRISGTRTAGSFVDIAGNNTGSNGATINVSYYGSGSYGPLKFITSGVEAARITSGGDVLINTTANVNSAKLKSKVSAGSFGLEVTDESQSDFAVAPLSGAVCRVGPTSGAMAFYTANSERARITSGGNFGIGTNNPQQALDVNGVARAANYYYQSNASSYASPSSTTLTMTSTGEGTLYLISASNHTGTTNVSHTMWMLSYSGTGASVVTQIATGGNYTPAISVSGSTVTLTNNSGSSRIIYASFIRLL